ncbi:ATP-binding cassette domain-containing protein [Candidatus Bathyarchaeota archaeon]|nr:ATP-binding cassette domain-containing protein [Candidatus Bathyarchaeota archaeon]MBS7627353.1 ATP-binding cassette domain-containing protein [Candidatus Bathyarchaeota archaeon]
MSHVKVKHLSYSYGEGEGKVLKDISLEIDKGEFVLLTGPSGCGKTTLCRCFNGLIPHFYGGKMDGEVSVAGLRVSEHPIHEMATVVGFVFQNPENQLFALTVERDVAFGLENLGLPKDEISKRVTWALKIVGMEEFRFAAPFELSGGQQQRVAIASVLAMQPEVIVLDEPTSFLDPATALNIFQILKRLNDELHMTIILVEHRLELASAYINRIVLMNEGSILLDGDPRSILSQEESRLLGIGVPKVVRLFRMLRAGGIPFEHYPLTPSEGAMAIRRLVKGYDQG